jgi:NAD(P)-dependent dehydrogenase (short-subunit alcohol dehydrogenase family)
MKTILITGTSSGVGATIAYDYIQKGWNVIGFARSESLFNYPNYKHYQVDISKIYTSLSDTFDQIGDTKIDILVNNAAVFKMKPFSETSIEEIYDMIDINLKGAMYVTKFALENMEKGSRIFFINSVAGLEELENQSVYCASKHGLTGFAGVLGKELQPKGIKVTSIHPGGIDTPLWTRDIPYPCGDVSQAISPLEVVKLIDFVYNSKLNIDYKTIKMFPDTEWHQ